MYDWSQEGGQPAVVLGWRGALELLYSACCLYRVPPVATQVETNREVMNPVVTPVELTQGTSNPRVNTPIPGPLLPPPMIMAASSMPGMNLMA